MTNSEVLQIAMEQSAIDANCNVTDFSSSSNVVVISRAYDDNRFIGMAGCSADCDSMWQIGIDVLPDYRRKGIASALTSRLAVEVVNREKVPFYSAAWSNIKSVRNAIASGFKPAWVELTAESCDLVTELNG